MPLRLGAKELFILAADVLGWWAWTCLSVELSNYLSGGKRKGRFSVKVYVFIILFFFFAVFEQRVVCGAEERVREFVEDEHGCSGFLLRRALWSRVAVAEACLPGRKLSAVPLPRCPNSLTAGAVGTVEEA